MNAVLRQCNWAGLVRVKPIGVPLPRMWLGGTRGLNLLLVFRPVRIVLEWTRNLV